MASKMAKGVGAEKLVSFDILERGFATLSPDDPLSVFDLQVGNLRIQVKRGENNGTNIKADLRRPSAKIRRYTAEEVDIFAVVDPVSRRVAYLHMTELVYGRRLTLFLTREHTRAGLPASYRAQYFEDYTDFRRVVAVAQSMQHAAA